MAFADELSDLKRDIAAAELPVSELLAAAGVDRSTWTRWNGGTFKPRFDTWASVRATADRLIAERGAQRDAAA